MFVIDDYIFSVASNLVERDDVLLVYLRKVCDCASSLPISCDMLTNQMAYLIN